MTTGKSCGSSYQRRVKASGDGSVSSGSAHGGRVFQCDGHGGEDDDALAEKVKKLKELLDVFEKKNKNAVENRRWFGCCSPVFFFILGFMICVLVGDADWVGLCGAAEMVGLGEGAEVDGGVGVGVECGLLIGCLGLGGGWDAIWETWTSSCDGGADEVFFFSCWLSISLDLSGVV
ncbi:hypothetical protein HN51_052634 [Arachis hypogaea]